MTKLYQGTMIKDLPNILNYTCTSDLKMTWKYTMKVHMKNS